MRLWLIITLISAACLISWNGSRFIGAQAQIRTKDLDFLPAPAVAKALALGHTNTVAKLRWIDSFAFFQLQLDRKDDTVATTGESAFERLYRMLVALDPHFVPYYEHAMLNLGGVLGKHGPTLSLLQNGLLALPHETTLWRLLAVELVTNFAAETKNPELMDATLQAWHAAETTDEGRQQVWDWSKAMARRQYKDLRQLSYWEEQLRLVAPNSPARQFIVDTMREQVARYGEEQFSRLLAEFKKQRFVSPALVDELCAPGVVSQVWPQRPPPFAPMVMQGSSYEVRPDPFGYRYEMLGDAVVSPGWQIHRLKQRGDGLTADLEKLAKRTGTWPSSLAEATAAGLRLEPLPPSCRWKLEGKRIVLHADPPPLPAWEPTPAR